MLPLSEVVELETISGWPYAAKAAANYAWVMRSYSLTEFASVIAVENADGVVRKNSLLVWPRFRQDKSGGVDMCSVGRSLYGTYTGCWCAFFA